MTKETDNTSKNKDIVLNPDLSWYDVPFGAWVNAVWLYAFGNGARIDPVTQGKQFEGDPLPLVRVGVVVSPRVISDSGEMVAKMGNTGREEYGGGYYRYSKRSLNKARAKLLKQQNH